MQFFYLKIELNMQNFHPKSQKAGATLWRQLFKMITPASPLQLVLSDHLEVQLNTSHLPVPPEAVNSVQVQLVLVVVLPPPAQKIMGNF